MGGQDGEGGGGREDEREREGRWEGRDVDETYYTSGAVLSCRRTVRDVRRGWRELLTPLAPELRIWQAGPLAG